MFNVDEYNDKLKNIGNYFGAKIRFFCPMHKKNPQHFVLRIVL